MIEHPHSPFFIFGAGDRPKLVYSDGRLVRLDSGEVLLECPPETVTVDAPNYTVTAERGRDRITITEDERGIWLLRDGEVECLAESPVALPDFEGRPHRTQLRVLHHEILVNIVDGRPLPNFLVYERPWYRDAAMMAMVLEKTGNLALIRDWVLSLREPYDRNNAGHEEPDNLGQVFCLVSLVADADHPVVDAVLGEAGRVEQDGHLCGMTDSSEHPVYQTLWLKFGLRRLGLDDQYVVPDVEDSYGTLCWWHEAGARGGGGRRYHGESENYPYLAWAEAHFFGDPPPMHLCGGSYPLTWEAHASQADYAGMGVIGPGFARARLSMPHTWHAAEMFLYLWERGRGGARTHAARRAEMLKDL